MPISESGQLSLGNIATEKGESLANISLATLSTNNINTQSPYYPDGAQPHSVSEFYGYDHNAGPSGPSDPILHYYELVGAYPSQEFACFDGPNVPPQSYYLDNVQPDLGVHAYSDRDGNEQIDTIDCVKGVIYTASRKSGTYAFHILSYYFDKMESRQIFWRVASIFAPVQPRIVIRVLKINPITDSWPRMCGARQRTQCRVFTSVPPIPLPSGEKVKQCRAFITHPYTRSLI